MTGNSNMATKYAVVMETFFLKPNKKVHHSAHLKVCVCGSYPCALPTHHAPLVGALLWEALRLGALRLGVLRVGALRLGGVLTSPPPHPLPHWNKQNKTDQTLPAQ